MRKRETEGGKSSNSVRERKESFRTRIFEHSIVFERIPQCPRDIALCCVEERDIEDERVFEWCRDERSE